MQTPGAPKSISDLFDAGLLAELRRIELKTRRNIDSDLMGKYRSAFRGSGLVFSDIREYQFGDDVKKIHWKITARSNKTYVKSYDEDRQLNIILAVDVSNSTNFGSRKTKHHAALEFAALIAMLARSSQDYIGLCLFSGKVEEFIPVNKSRGHTQRLLMKLIEPRSLGMGTDVREALDFLSRNQRRTSIIFVISDFYSPPFEHELKLLGLRHDVICVMLEDQMDSRLPPSGIAEFADAETGERYLIDTGSRSARKKLEELHARRVQALEDSCKAAGVDLLRVSDNPLRPLAQLMNMRTARIR